MKIKGVRKLSAGLLIFLFADERYTVNPFKKTWITKRVETQNFIYLFW